MPRPVTGLACQIKVSQMTTANKRDNVIRVCFPSVNRAGADFGETMLIGPWVDETVGLTRQAPSTRVQARPDGKASENQKADKDGRRQGGVCNLPP